MKTKVICWLLACAILMSATVLPIGVFATGEENQPTDQTDATVSTDATDSTDVTEATQSTDSTDTTDSTDATDTTDSTDATDATDVTDPTDVTDATDPTEITPPDDGTLKISDEMMVVLKKMEGFAEYAYWDYKQWSIGYGSRCPEGMEKYYQEHPITEEYAEELLRKELDYFEKEVNDFIKEKGLTVTQNQYDALVSFSYNCGANWTNETTGYFHNGVLSGNLGSEFVYGMFLWSTAGGQYVLLPRRICETYIYTQGKYEHRWWPEDEQYRYVYMDANGGSVNYYIHGFDTSDPTAIRTKLTTAPTGPDEHGAIVTYVFDGWYTEREGGTKVEILDSTMISGTVLFAHWKTPAGTPVTIPRQDTGISVNITITKNEVNVRSGPQTYYAVIDQLNKGDQVLITETVTSGSYLWGRFGDSWIRLDNTDYNDVIGGLFPIWGKVTGDNVNVRSGAGLSNSVVTMKNKGDLVLIKRWVSEGGRMWGETSEGWIAMSYVSLENVDAAQKEIKSVAVRQNPAKLKYYHKLEELDLTGGLLLVTFTDGTTQVLDMSAAEVTGFDNSTTGAHTLTVTLENVSTTFIVEVIRPTVKFLMDDGTVISEKEYLVGETVEIPPVPEKPGDSNGIYVFVGWDKEVTPCAGNDVYTAVFKQVELVGDIDKNGSINDRDVIYLLGHVLFPEIYTFTGIADLDSDGSVNDRDAIYLLGYVLFPDAYPLPGERADA